MASNIHIGKNDLRILVIGHGANLLAVRLALGIFRDEYDPTQGTWRIQKVIQGRGVIYDITDITSLESFELNPNYLKYHLDNTHVLISVVEPTRPESTKRLETVRFGELGPLFEERKQTGTIAEGVIVLWHEDGMTSMSHDTEQWKAGMARGQEYAKKADAHGPFYAYAQTGIGAEEAFETMAIKGMEVWRRTVGEERVSALSLNAARAANEDVQVRAESSVWQRLGDWIIKRKYFK